MANNKNQNLEMPFGYPFRNIDVRDVLDSFRRKVKEKPMKSHKNGNMQVSPSILSLSIVRFAKSHLDLIIECSTDVDLAINIEQKTQLYFEFLTLYYFLIGKQVNKYLKGDQFTLFLMQLHVELLDNLPKYKGCSWIFGVNPFTRSKKIKKFIGRSCANTGGLSRYLFKGEDFYIKDKLISDGTGVWQILKDDEYCPTNDEIQGYEQLKRLLLPDEAKVNNFKLYKQELMLQFMVKNLHLVLKILNLYAPDDLFRISFFYECNSKYMHLVQKERIGYFQPAWDSAL